MSDGERLLRRVGILGDIHAEDLLLAVALEALRGHENLDTLLAVGDILTGRGNAGQCVDLLVANNVLAVRGNHDRWFLSGPTAYRESIGAFATPEEQLTPEHRNYLASLPATRSFDTPRGPLLLCHGLGSNDMAGVYPKDGPVMLSANSHLQTLIQGGGYRFVVNGHTHARMVRPVENLTLINAGTLRRDHAPGFLVADFEEGWVQGFDLDPESGTVSEGGRASL